MRLDDIVNITITPKPRHPLAPFARCLGPLTRQMLKEELQKVIYRRLKGAKNNARTREAVRSSMFRFARWVANYEMLYGVDYEADFKHDD